ncbi:uncharacterized protein PGTG_22298 [Puccinia graminis f. sp. tritici CRL 75-36-700-3]|uniref:Uncharacterized protein n=1 Tax=Puccinia graminis f. sp. tritici (strain CRL 75-36-700-3 / race SCCL) TaxID=418459 RepID=H6QU18_PUCGT|nr:uncharacterized protein PGTG_22298 [Puccinia graminis f. sp. tritici CRL 75-36-700-3]EHS64427.1 hypothetical protein PGTG_22298 [Puccinia graminis f. sp. tritici CRL 75-36-700-3]
MSKPAGALDPASLSKMIAIPSDSFAGWTTSRQRCSGVSEPGLRRASRHSGTRQLASVHSRKIIELNIELNAVPLLGQKGGAKRDFPNLCETKTLGLRACPSGSHSRGLC